MVRILAGLIGAALLATGVLAAPAFDDPAELLEFAYSRYDADDYPEAQTDLYSPTLTALLEGDEGWSEEGAGALDFDPFVNGQDFDLSNLVIHDPEIDGDIAFALATFDNFDTQQMLFFTLVDSGEGWKIDDIESVAPGREWLLSEILAVDPLLN